MGHRTARLLGGLGRALITLGVLVILFAGYQLWGTGLAEQRAQDQLADSFLDRRDAVWSTSTTSSTAAASTTTAPPETGSPPATAAPPSSAPPRPVVAPELAEELRPGLGDTIGRIAMPTIGVDKYVVHGVRRSDLRRGPGHYPDTPLPGQAGNAAIAGHRTTYGAPFGDLDRLEPGDEIIVETLQGRFRYEVMPQLGRDGTTSGHVIVGADAVEVVGDFGDDRLTLTACHPKYSAAKRIVVMAELVGPPAPGLDAAASSPGGDGEVAAEPARDGGGGAATGDGVERGEAGTATGEGAGADRPDGVDADGVDADGVDADGVDADGVDADGVVGGGDAADAGGRGDLDEVAAGETLGWDTAQLPATAAWAGVTALAAGVIAALGRVWRRWPARLLGSPFVAVALYTTFSHLDRMLPAL